MEDKENPLGLTVDDYRALLVTHGRRTKAAVTRLANERQRLRDWIGAASRAGVSELEISRLSGIPRITVRDWLGK